MAFFSLYSKNNEKDSRTRETTCVWLLHAQAGRSSRFLTCRPMTNNSSGSTRCALSVGQNAKREMYQVSLHFSLPGVQSPPSIPVSISCPVAFSWSHGMGRPGRTLSTERKWHWWHVYSPGSQLARTPLCGLIPQAKVTVFFKGSDSMKSESVGFRHLSLPSSLLNSWSFPALTLCRILHYFSYCCCNELLQT